MFTGLIEEMGTVRRIERGGAGARVVIGAQTVLANTKVGDSISVNGACLTVTAVGGDEFTADCMPETLERTSLARAGRGTAVNLERALALGDRLGGHLVTGHVDAVSEVKAIERRGDSLEIRLSLPGEVAAFVSEKGSVALDGVSLTVISVSETVFVVGLIPHTIAVTTLQSLTEGAVVNVEADVMARYVHRSLTAMGLVKESGASGSAGLSLELLVEKGFA